MKALRLLGLPWMAWSDGARMLISALCALIGAAIVVSLIATHQPGVAPSLKALHGIAVADFAFWAIAMSQTMLLTREARRLRMPALGHDVRMSLSLYAALTIALPALLLAGLGTNGALALTELALGAGLGLCYTVLPVWLGVWIGCIPMLTDSVLTRWLPMPILSPPGFLDWAAPCTLALWLLVAIHWQRAAHREHESQGASRPLLLGLRTMSWYGRNHLLDATESRRLQRRRWWRSTADLRGCGPGRPVTSLRLAMGNWAMPQTPASWLRQLANWIVAFGLAAAFLAFIGYHDSQHDDDFNPAWVFAVMSGMLVAQAHARTLHRRWSRPNAELSLLALLPHLGGKAPIRHDLLRACLLPAFAVQCLMTVAVLGVAAHLHLHAAVLVGLFLAQLLGMAMLAATTLSILGGNIIDGFMPLTMIAFMVIAVLGAVIVSGGTPSLAALASTVLALVLIWSFLFVPLLFVAWKSWRTYQRRPHPFLANQP